MKTVEGKRQSRTFDTEAEAVAFIADAQARLVRDGRAIEDVIDAYLASLTAPELPPEKRCKPGTVTTLGYRLRAVIAGRQRVPIGTFPWVKAWEATAGKQARASQIGIMTALRAVMAFAGLGGEPLRGIVVKGEVSEGKEQLTVDEGRRFVVVALAEGDPLAVAAATLAFCGLRPAEVLALVARNVDAGGALLHVPGTKTKAAKRKVNVDPAFAPYLLAQTEGKAPGDLLFPWTPERVRARREVWNEDDETNARKDALLRRVRQLCRAAGVPEVVSHSMRGLNATLRLMGGADDASITRALGHLNITSTKRHYFAPGAVAARDDERSHGRLLPSRVA